ncbi:hypothetical protein C1637_15225 [Chryseobacterium lactis]|uniref:Uncharacterized protein n=1 Tax=Chryseobacterium lactis TaxID=1241981 RepID=A0A3G6RR33_CHRLC|nr:hypothetical protein [Chryseobacterium lactis]AZA83536.1 hypothetical protein EG342_17340 [Chryseobacterium lactis]AZB03920.1 hypothetical protein EG341_08215 [Chryseobacterium lactis]PNW13170.1 hypothetical protein C1637_15225 [Chryseobacterium lactis]
MIFPKAKKIARELDWYKTDDGVFGLYKGYFFNVSDASVMSTPQFKFVTVITGSLAEEQRLQIKAELATNKRKLKFTSFEILDDGIFFKFAENITFTKLKTVYALFDFLADQFKRLNIAEQNKCHRCGKNQKINYYNLHDTGIILCDTCFNNAILEFQTNREVKEVFYQSIVISFILASLAWIWLLFFMKDNKLIVKPADKF